MCVRVVGVAVRVCEGPGRHGTAVWDGPQEAGEQRFNFVTIHRSRGDRAGGKTR